jgi:hypothetical protein
LVSIVSSRLQKPIYILNAALIEMLRKNLDYSSLNQSIFPRKQYYPSHGYQPEYVTIKLKKISPQIMTKINFKLLKKLWKSGK